MILYFLLASYVFCAEPYKVLVDASVFEVAREDKQVYVKQQGASYDEGSVWVRTHSDATGEHCMRVYYRPEGANAQCSKGKSQKICYMRQFSKEELSQGGHMKELLQDVTSGVGGTSWQAACAKKYKVSEADITCAAVTALREALTGAILDDGVQHPEFDSWARYLPSTGCYAHAYRGRKVIYGVDRRYTEGNIWLAKGENGKNILFYRPDFGPNWMYYRFDLDQDQGWPKNWRAELDLLRDFARSEIYTLLEFAASEKCGKVCDAIMATLSGRTARWNKGVWFAWRPQCEENDPFLRAQQQDRLQGGKVYRGVYSPGSLWLTQLPSKVPVCRARSRDGGVFQIAEANFPPGLWDDILWFAPKDGKYAVEFIFGSNASDIEFVDVSTAPLSGRTALLYKN